VSDIVKFPARVGALHRGHPRWREFVTRLSSAEGCDFREETPGDPRTTTWKCHGESDKSFAIGIMRAMGLTEEEIRASVLYFDANGGHCDCEILLNVDLEAPTS